MKLKKVQTNNFMGLPAVKIFDFSAGKIVALCDKNRVGKTSVLKAVGYVLTGQEPSGEIVHEGATSCAVQAEFEDGAKIARMKPAAKGKPTKFYVGEKDGKLASTTLTVLSKTLEKECGRVVENAKIIASSELLRALSGQQLSELFLNYIPELLTKQDVLSRLKGLTAEQEKLLGSALPEGEFSPKAVDELGKGFCEERRKAGKTVTECQAVIHNLEENSAEPQYTREQLEEFDKSLKSKRDAAVAFAAKNTEYMNACAAAEKHKAQLAALDEQISRIKAVRTPQEERDALANDLEQAVKEERASSDAMQEANVQGKALRNSIRTIAQQVCPLSDKLVCTTDKTSVVGDLQAEFEACGARYKEQKAVNVAAKNKIDGLKAKLQEIDAGNKEADRLDGLKAERGRLLETAPVVPEKPKPCKDPSVYDEQIKKCQAQLSAIENAEKLKQLKGQLEAAQAEYRKYDALVGYFSAKGAIKKAITEFYLDSFAAPCNEKAEKLFHGMNIKFIAEEGITMKIDMGTGRYLSFNSLSEGEKVCVLFLLMSMLAELSGFRILILDELSVLDAETFKKLLEVMKEHEQEYDLAILACVNHTDTVETLNAEGIPILKIS